MLPAQTDITLDHKSIFFVKSTDTVDDLVLTERVLKLHLHGFLGDRDLLTKGVRLVTQFIGSSIGQALFLLLHQVSDGNLSGALYGGCRPTQGAGGGVPLSGGDRDVRVCRTDAGGLASFSRRVLRMFALHRVVELDVGFQQALLTEGLVTVLIRTLVVVVFRLNDEGLGR